MSSLEFKNTSKKMENAKFWREFFQLYKELPALWRVKSTEYSDRALKSTCYLKLVRKLKEIYPDADREMVVRKINNFRTSYRKEVKRLKEIQEAGKIYRPTLWYFDCLTFLDDQEEAGERSMCEEENGVEVLTKMQTRQSVSSNPPRLQQIPAKRKLNTNDTDEEEFQDIPSTSKTKKMIHRIKPPKLSHEEQKQAQIDADILAQSWAVQYKDMQGNQKLIARKIISDILFHGCIGTLNMSHTVDIQEILWRNSSSSQQNHHMPPQSPLDSNTSLRLADQEYFNYESARESPPPPIEYNGSNQSMSPTNDNSEFQINEIKFEV